MSDDDAGDAELMAALAREGCRGPLWTSTADELARYGRAVLLMFFDKDRIQGELAEAHRPLRLTEDDLRALAQDRSELHSLVDEGVAKGLDLFRTRAVLAGHWRPDGGAGVRTYFVNACLKGLHTPLRRWAADHRRDRRVTSCEPVDLDALRDLDDRTHAGDVVDVLLLREDTRRVLEQAGPLLTRYAFLKIETGLPDARIAGLIGTTPKGLERRLHRFRQHHTRVGSPDDDTAA